MGQLLVPELRSACPTTQVSGQQIRNPRNSAVSRLPHTFGTITRCFKAQPEDTGVEAVPAGPDLLYRTCALSSALTSSQGLHYPRKRSLSEGACPWLEVEMFSHIIPIQIVSVQHMFLVQAVMSVGPKG